MQTITSDYIVYLKILKSKKSNVLMLNADINWSIEKLLCVIKEMVIQYLSNKEKIFIDDINVIEPDMNTKININLENLPLLKPHDQVLREKYGDNSRRLVFYVTPIYKTQDIKRKTT